MSGATNNIQATSGFGFKGVIVGSLDFSGTCILHISCVK